LHIPLLQNPNRFGIRLPVSSMKMWRTIGELKRDHSGFSLSLWLGWCREDEMWDPSIRIELDMEFSPQTELELVRRSDILRNRFAQRSIYM
jgi:hypothetical protein